MGAVRNRFYYLCSKIARNLDPLSLHLTLIIMARIMAFDYGTKRVGIAVTDPLQIIATGLETIHPKNIINYLSGYFEAETVERFIVGFL